MTAHRHPPNFQKYEFFNFAVACKRLGERWRRGKPPEIYPTPPFRGRNFQKRKKFFEFFQVFCRFLEKFQDF